MANSRLKNQKVIKETGSSVRHFSSAALIENENHINQELQPLLHLQENLRGVLQKSCSYIRKSFELDVINRL